MLWSIPPFIHLLLIVFIHSSAYHQLIHHKVFLTSILLYIYLFTHFLPIHLIIHPFHLPSIVHLLNRFSTHSTTHPFIHLSYHLFILFTYPIVLLILPSTHSLITHQPIIFSFIPLIQLHLEIFWCDLNLPTMMILNPNIEPVLLLCLLLPVGGCMDQVVFEM